MCCEQVFVLGNTNKDDCGKVLAASPIFAKAKLRAKQAEGWMDGWMALRAAVVVAVAVSVVAVVLGGACLVAGEGTGDACAQALKVYIVDPPCPQQSTAPCNWEFVSDGNTTSAFGPELTVRNVLAALEKARNLDVSATTREALVYLAQHGWLRSTNEYRLAQMMHHRLWNSDHRAQRIEDAHAVFTYGCTESYNRFYQRETALIASGALSQRLPRFHVRQQWKW